MGTIASLVIFAAGAIMRFAVTATSPDFNVHTVGVILMIVGAVGFVISLIAWSTWWGGLGSFGRRRRVVRQGPAAVQTPVAGAVPGTAYPAGGYPAGAGYPPAAGYEEEKLRLG